MPYGIQIAEARKAEQIRRLRREVESLEAEVGRSQFGADGTQVPHLAGRRAELQRQIGEREDEISRPGRLSPDQLVTELVPEIERARVAEKAAESTGRDTMNDMLPGRSPQMSEQAVVHTTPPPVRRIGPEPSSTWMHEGWNIPANAVLTYDANGNLVPAA
jgi:hypothetical protein